MGARGRCGWMRKGRGAPMSCAIWKRSPIGCSAGSSSPTARSSPSPIAWSRSTSPLGRSCASWRSSFPMSGCSAAPPSVPWAASARCACARRSWPTCWRRWGRKRLPSSGGKSGSGRKRAGACRLPAEGPPPSPSPLGGASARRPCRRGWSSALPKAVTTCVFPRRRSWYAAWSRPSCWLTAWPCGCRAAIGRPGGFCRKRGWRTGRRPLWPTAMPRRSAVAFCPWWKSRSTWPFPKSGRRCARWPALLPSTSTRRGRRRRPLSA